MTINPWQAYIAGFLYGCLDGMMGIQKMEQQYDEKGNLFPEIHVTFSDGEEFRLSIEPIDAS